MKYARIVHEGLKYLSFVAFPANIRKGNFLNRKLPTAEEGSRGFHSSFEALKGKVPVLN
jgi:hypothetical protein